MAVVDDAGLKKQMAAGELSGLFVVAGEEKYMVKRLARQLIQRAAGDAFPEFNDQPFTNESSLDSIGDAAQAFFAQRKCVSVADFDVESKSAQELEKLYELWELSPETTTLVFWYPTLDFDEKRSSKWKKFLKQAQERGTVALCGRRSQTELLRFLSREAEKAGCGLSRPVGQKLLEYAGMDLTALPTPCWTPSFTSGRSRLPLWVPWPPPTWIWCGCGLPWSTAVPTGMPPSTATTRGRTSA